MRFIFSKALISPLINKSKEEFDGKFFMEFILLDIGQNNKKFLNSIKEMVGFNGFFNDIMKKRCKLIKNGYGGMLPIFKSKPILYVS